MLMAAVRREYMMKWCRCWVEMIYAPRIDMNEGSILPEHLKNENKLYLYFIGCTKGMIVVYLDYEN